MLYVKIGKTTSKRYANCLNWIKHIRNIVDQNKFLRLYYFKNNKIFFCFVTTVIIPILTSSHYQEVIKKLNNNVIARLTTNKRLNILSNTQRFNTSVNLKMLRKKIKMWPVDSFFNITLMIISMHITNLDYLEDGPLCFTELFNGDTEESNRILVGLNTTVVILEINNQNLLDLIDLKVKYK